MTMQETTSWSRFGMRVIERLARTRSATPAAARLDHSAGCCHLALKSDAGCADKCRKRPAYRMRTWGCCQAGQFYSCQECTKGDTCHEGPYLCSYATRVPGGC